MNGTRNTSGLCQCGCGGMTSIIPRSDTKKGLVRGERQRFMHGHNARVREYVPAPQCTVRGCTRSGGRKDGMCANHYKMAWKAAQPKTQCLSEGCVKDAYATGMCAAHYMRSRPTVIMMDAKALKRFFAKVTTTDSGCWEWQAFKTDKGYGIFKLPGSQKAHRASYQHFVGPIPDGMEIDHLCANRGCVNPEHLEAVTHSENIRRVHNRDEAS